MKLTVLFVIGFGVIALVSCCMSGCSPLYVMRAAYEESKILLAREDIDEVLADPKSPEEIRAKLSLVKRARAFALQIGLDAGDSYTKYSHVSKEVLAWVLLACKKDRFEPHTWWYPIVGTVPYKGFFERDDARCDIERLERRGYETWLRGTEAFSTLGWFNDPILTTTLKHEPHAVANTVIHEIFHQTVWIPGSVDFNESVANFVGTVGAIEFFRLEQETCEDDECRMEAGRLLAAAEESWQFEKELAEVLQKVKGSLTELYESDLPLEAKLHERDQIFQSETAEFLERYPKLKVLRKLNNAEVLQLALYRKRLDEIEALYLRCGRVWGCFLESLKSIAEAEPADPFDELGRYPQSSEL